MSEELQKQLAELLKQLMTAANSAGTWVGEQIPPLVQDKIMLGRVEETIWMVLLTGWLGLMVVMTKKLWKWALVVVKTDDDCEPAFLLPCLTLFGGAIPWLLQIRPTAMAWVAPRLYIVEWLSDLVKK